MEEQDPTKEGTPKTELNDAYWFSIAKDMVSGAHDRLDKSIDSFEKLILWLWGIYTPLIGIGAGVINALQPQQQLSTTSLIVFLLPSLTLLVSYWLTTKAKSSTTVKFDHRVVDQIKSEFNFSLATKNYYFTRAKVLILVSFLLFPVALFVYHYPDKNGQQTVYTMDVKKSAINTGIYRITISANLPREKEITLTISPFEKGKDNRTMFKTGKNGVLQTYFDIPIAPNTKPEFLLKASWQETVNGDEKHGRFIIRKIL